MAKTKVTKPEKPDQRGGWFSRDSPINQPVVIIIATALIQYLGWNWQQDRLLQQSTDAAGIAEAKSSLENAVMSVGKRLTADAIIVGAHEARFEAEQLKTAIERFHSLRTEWDLSEDLLNHRIRVQFPATKIQVAWENLRKELEHLESLIVDLSRYDSTDPSAAHLKAIETSRRKVTEIEAKLAELSKEMTETRIQALRK